MVKACPIITCDAPIAFARHWWKPLVDAGYSVQFFRDAISATPQTAEDFSFSDTPTLFGGRVYLGMTKAGGIRIESGSSGNSLEVDVAVYGPTASAIRAVMLASGCSYPREVDFRFESLAEFSRILGGYAELYAIDEPFISTWRSSLALEGYRIVRHRCGKRLAVTCLLGKLEKKETRWHWWRKRGELLLMPYFDLAQSRARYLIGFTSTKNERMVDVLGHLPRYVERHEIAFQLWHNGDEREQSDEEEGS